MVVMLGIFAAWAIPFLRATGHATATTKWSQQFTGRLRGSDFEFGRWIFNIPHGVLYLLPWVIFCLWRDLEILPWRKIDNLRKRWLGVRSFLLSLSILYRDRFRGTGCRRLCPRAGCSL